MMLFDRRSGHTLSRLLMPTSRRDCGHLKASWDNHTNCLSCFSYSRFSTCLVCEDWTTSTWYLADNSSTMTKTKSSKKEKRMSARILSKDISTKHYGITTHHCFTARGRPHNGDIFIIVHIINSVSPPGMGHQSPGIRQSSSQSPGTRH